MAAIDNSLIVLATVAGPILAVQAQKWIESARAVAGRREYVFSQLMATRGARLDPDHVRALNMIDLAYYGRRLFGRPLRGKKSQAVLDCWRDYHDRLSTNTSTFSDGQWSAFIEQNEEIFLRLLDAMATERGINLDRAVLRKGAYHPNAMVEAFREGNLLRTKALAVLSGEQTLKVDITQE